MQTRNAEIERVDNGYTLELRDFDGEDYKYTTRVYHALEDILDALPSFFAEGIK